MICQKGFLEWQLLFSMGICSRQTPLQVDGGITNKNPTWKKGEKAQKYQLLYIFCACNMWRFMRMVRRRDTGEYYIKRHKDVLSVKNHIMQ